MDSPLCLQRLERSHQRNELHQEPAEHKKRYGTKQKPQKPLRHYIQIYSMLLLCSRVKQPIAGLQNAPDHSAQHCAQPCITPAFRPRRPIENGIGICPKNRRQPQDLLHIGPRFPPLIIGDGLPGCTQLLCKRILRKFRPFPQIPYVLSNITHFYRPHIEPTTEMGICHARILLHALHLLQKSPSRFILQIAIETGTLSQHNGQNTVINAT